MARLYRECRSTASGRAAATSSLSTCCVCCQLLAAKRGLFFLDEVRRAKGGDRRLDRLIARLEGELGAPEEHEARARRIVERIAVCLQASLVIRHLPAGRGRRLLRHAARRRRRVGLWQPTGWARPARHRRRARPDLQCRTLRTRSLWSPAGQRGSDGPRRSLSAGAATSRRGGPPPRRGREGDRCPGGSRRHRAVHRDRRHPAAGHRRAASHDHRGPWPSRHRVQQRGLPGAAHAGRRQPEDALDDRVFDTDARSTWISACSIHAARMRTGAAARSWQLRLGERPAQPQSRPGADLGVQGRGDSLTRAAAMEYAEKGVRINAVAPGRVVTDMMLASKIMGMVRRRRPAAAASHG